MGSIEMMSSFVESILYYTISRVNIIVFFMFVFLCIQLFKILCKYNRMRRLTNLIPGIKCQNLILGNLQILTSGVNSQTGVDAYQAFFQALRGLCTLFDRERIFRFWIGFDPVVVIYKPESVETILSSNSILKKSPQYNLLTPWLGYGLLTSDGHKWRSRRKLLTPSFHFRILEDFLPIMNEHMNTFTHLLSEQTLVNNGIIEDITPYITRCALDIICETAMGIKMDSQIHCDSPYVKAIHETGELFLLRMITPWLWNDYIYGFTRDGKKFNQNLNVLHSFTDKVIKERKKELLEEKSINKNERTLIRKEETNDCRRRMAFLDSLLSEHFMNKEFTEEDIREEVDTFMFEGHDTTSMAISWTLHLIGLNQQILDKCHEELDNIFVGTGSDRPIDMNDLRQMKYLEACIKEGLRLFPSVPFVGRQLTEEISINGYRVPKGVICMIVLYQVHRDPQCFTDPEVYRPERFLDNSHLTRHPFAFVPFSAGPRNCVGQKFALLEEKTILATILRKYNIKSLNFTDQIKVAPEMVIRPKTPLKMRFTPRNT